MGNRLPIALFVGTWLPYSESFIYDQVMHQQRSDIKVFARSLSRHAAHFPYKQVHTLPVPEFAPYWALRRASSFTRALKTHGTRVIHAHFGTNGTIARSFACRLDVPLVVTFHGHDISGLLPQNRHTLRYARYRRAARRMFDEAALLLCASEELAELLVRRVGVPAGKVRVHRLGIDLNMFAPPKVCARDTEHMNVLMVGRLVEKKGMPYGLEAFARVHRVCPKLRLRIVGDGPMRPLLDEKAQALGIQDAVTFTGIRDVAGVREEMHDAHLIMAPSTVAQDGDRDSGLMVLKEAGACGLPSVATRHGGIPEIIVDEETGFLVPERDVERLAGRLQVLVQNPDLRTRMGQCARIHMERHYDTRRQNERLEALLESVS